MTKGIRLRSVGAAFVVGSLQVALSAHQSPAMTERDAFQVGGSAGCGLLRLYAWNTTRTVAIVVSADQRFLTVDEAERAFDLARSTKGLLVHRDVFTESQSAFDYCSDVRNPTEPVVYVARSGRLTIATRAGRATARLENATFENRHGTLISVNGPLIIAGYVGWFPP